MTSISIQQTKMIAAKANLKITETELKKFQKDLQSIFEYASKLEQVNTSEIDGEFQTNYLSNVVREDVVKHSLTLNEALTPSSKTMDDAFITSAILK